MLISGIKKYFRSKKEKRAKIKEMIRKIDFSEIDGFNYSELRPAAKKIGEIARGRMRHYCPAIADKSKGE
jgi:hypothetical protein